MMPTNVVGMRHCCVRLQLYWFWKLGRTYQGLRRYKTHLFCQGCRRYALFSSIAGFNHSVLQCVEGFEHDKSDPAYCHCSLYYTFRPQSTDFLKSTHACCADETVILSTGTAGVP